MFVLLSHLAKEFQELDIQFAATIRNVGEYDRSGDWAADGYASAAAALQDQCRMDAHVAHAHVRLARRLAKVPEVEAAFGAGEISHEHVVVITNAYRPARAAELSNVEDVLVAAAKELAPKELAVAVKYVTDAIDGDRGANDDQAAIDDNACYMSFTNGKLVFNGQCDQLTGELIVAAVNAEMDRDLQAADERTTPRRRLDALANLCRLPLERGELGETHGVRPHLSVSMDAHDIDDITPGQITDIRLQARRTNLSATSLEFLLCDCTMSRIIMAGRSEVLDVGRTTATVTPAQWKALVARDRHCQHPGCKRPPSDCHAHHIRHWAHGGPTDLDNLQLLCWHHHRQHHIEDAKTRAANRDP
jgi:hypothetical protein